MLLVKLFGIFTLGTLERHLSPASVLRAPLEHGYALVVRTLNLITHCDFLDILTFRKLRAKLVAQSQGVC